MLTAGMALAPLSAFAAFTAPSELAKALVMDDKARSFSVELQAQKAPYYVTVWANGTVKGSDPSSAIFSMKATADVVWLYGNTRIKMQMRKTDESTYAMIDSIDGKMEDATAKLVASFKMKKWFQIPDESIMEEVTDNSMGMLSESDAESMDALFTMTSAPGKNGTTVYTLKPTELMAEQLKDALQEVAAEMDSESMEPPEPMLTVTVTTDAANHLVSGSIAMTAKATDGMLKLTANTWQGPASFTVNKPSPIMSMFDGLFGWGGAGEIENWPAWIGLPTTDINADDNWTDPWGSDSSGWPDGSHGNQWDEDSSEYLYPYDGTEGEYGDYATPTCNASELRRGECPEMLPTSPRRQ